MIRGANVRRQCLDVYLVIFSSKVLALGITISRVVRLVTQPLNRTRERRFGIADDGFEGSGQSVEIVGDGPQLVTRLEVN